MADSNFKVINTLTGDVVFIGSFEQCEKKVLNDLTGFLELCDYA